MATEIQIEFCKNIFLNEFGFESGGEEEKIFDEAVKKLRGHEHEDFDSICEKILEIYPEWVAFVKDIFGNVPYISDFGEYRNALRLMKEKLELKK